MSFRKSLVTAVRAQMLGGGTVFFLSLVIGFGLALISGCGGGDGGDNAILATVGQNEITADYYMEKLGKLEDEELPRDDAGNIMNTGTQEGRLAFMEVLVNKELMVLKAYELGYDKDDQIHKAKESMADYHASTFMRVDEIEKPSNFISEEEFDYYVTRLGESRHCNFVICNFMDDALAAKKMGETAENWMDVVNAHHASEVRPNIEYKITIPWGKYIDSFERGVFEVEVGGVTDPIETEHGYWVIRVNEVTNIPETKIEERRGVILSSVRQRKNNLLMKDYVERVRAEHKLVIEEDALWVVYQGLPGGEYIIDPETNKPVPQEELNELIIDPKDLDLLLFSYETLAGPTVYTIGDYKAHFDQMNAFQRPKASESLCGLRSKLLGEVDVPIMRDEGRRRNYIEDPRVIKALNKQIEQMMVSSLHQDVAKYDEHVGPEALAEYWEAHKENYFEEESRSGYAVFCNDREKADKAYQAAVAGTSWKQMMKRFDTNPENQKNDGAAGPFPASFVNPYKVGLYSIAEEDGVCEPFLNEGKWVVMKLAEIVHAHQPELATVREQVGRAVKLARQDIQLKGILDEWRLEYPVEINLEELNQMPDFAGCRQHLEELRLERARGHYEK